jgi:hypothetical protein
MESYPEGWVRINLIIDPETNQMYATGGDREPCRCEGDDICCDTSYIGFELLKKMMCKCD